MARGRHVAHRSLVLSGYGIEHVLLEPRVQRADARLSPPRGYSIVSRVVHSEAHLGRCQPFHRTRRFGVSHGCGHLCRRARTTEQRLVLRPEPQPLVV